MNFVFLFLLLTLSFQNCTQLEYGIDASDGNQTKAYLVESGGGNGSGYEGKLLGTFYRLSR